MVWGVQQKTTIFLGGSNSTPNWKMLVGTQLSSWFFIWVSSVQTLVTFHGNTAASSKKGMQNPWVCSNPRWWSVGDPNQALWIGRCLARTTTTLFAPPKLDSIHFSNVLVARKKVLSLHYPKMRHQVVYINTQDFGHTWRPVLFTNEPFTRVT